MRLQKLIVITTAFLQKRHHIILALIALLCGMVIATSTFAAANIYTRNSDAHASTYSYGPPFRLHDTLILDTHTQIFKIPLFYAQYIIGYNYWSYTISCLLLVMTLILVILALAYKLTGGVKGALACLIALAILFSAAPVLVENIVYPTIRNIEIALYLLLLYFLMKIAPVHITPFGKNKLRLSILTGSLALLLSGDQYFLYILAAVTILLGVIRYLSERIILITPFVIVGASYLISLLINKAIALSGILDIQFSIYGKPYIINFDQLGSQLGTLIHELFIIFGADFFGKQIGMDLLIYIPGLILLLSTYIMSFRILRRSRKYSYFEQVLALSAIVIPAVYIMSAQATGYQIRYISPLPFIGILIFLLHTQKQKLMHGNTAWITITIACLILASSIPTLRERLSMSLNAKNYYYAAAATIDRILTEENVETGITGHWNSASLTFLTNSKVNLVPVDKCNKKVPFLVKRQWYTANLSTENKSAIIIDKISPDNGVWSCGASEIDRIYGKPVKTVQTNGLYDDREQIEINIYDYDVRQRLVD